MAYNIRYSDYPTSAGPPDPIRWVGPPGPPGPQGEPGVDGTQGLTHVVVADTAPSGAPDSTLWWDSAGTGLYVRYNDGNSTQWVVAQNQNSLSDAPSDANTYGRHAGTWVNLTSGANAFLPLSGGTIGSTPYGQTMFTFNPVNPRNGSGALMLNKVSGSAVGDDPQITSYFHQDHNGSANPYHVQIVSNASSQSGMWALMNQSYISGYDDGTTNGHVGFYSQQLRTGVNTGGTRGIPAWCSVLELRSQTGLPSSQDGILQVLELDLIANGADDLSHSVGFGRTVLSIVIGQDNPSGAPVEVSNGISFFMYSAGSAGHYINMLTASAPFTGSVLNTTRATQQSGANAIWLADGHNVSFNTAGTATAHWDGTYIQFNNAVQIDGLLFAVGNLTVGGLATFAGTVAGAGFNSLFAAPPAIGGTTAASGHFTTLVANAGATLQGGGVWSSFGVGKQLILTSGGNPGLGITDSTGANPFAIFNLGTTNGLAFAAMPPLADTTTSPTFLFSMTTAGCKFNSNVGFNNTAPIAKPTVSGAKNTNPALASLLTALAAYGLVTDSTTA